MTEAQTFRHLTEARILRALAAGGMIVLRGDQAILLRHRDRRSHRIGCVPPHVFARLQSEARWMLTASC
jgi:hypothetical protein